MSGLKATAQPKALKLTWKKSSSMSGYEIQYSTSKNFASAKTFKISKSKTSYTIKKLKGSKKYYVRIRAYKNYTDELGQKVTAEGKWSSAVSKSGKVTAKNEGTVTITVTVILKNGKTKTVKMKITVK